MPRFLCLLTALGLPLALCGSTGEKAAPFAGAIVPPRAIAPPRAISPPPGAATAAALATASPAPGNSEAARRFTFVFLRAGPKEASLSAEALSTASAGHFANMRRLGDEGVLLLAGPFDDPASELRGLFILDIAEQGDAERVVSTDPAVVAGALDPAAAPFESAAPLRRILELRRAARQARAARDPAQADAFDGRAYVLGLLPADDREDDKADNQGDEQAGGRADARAIGRADDQAGDKADDRITDEISGRVDGDANETSRAPLDAFLASPATLFQGRLGGSFDHTLLICLDATDLDQARELLDQAGLGALPFDLRVLWATGVIEQLPRLRQRPDAPVFEIKPLPEDGPLASFRPAFQRVVDVFGIPVVATDGTADRALLHAARCLAGYLDNDEDGAIDDERVLQALHEQGAFLAMAASARELQQRDLDWEGLEAAGFRLGQDLYADETQPDGAPHRREAGRPFDAALEEVLHLVSQGWALAWPEAFSFQPGSRLTQAMDIARGAHLEAVPDRYPEQAWYHYDDRTCDYPCMAAEYFYWSLTSLLGGQDFPGRADAIADEWELPTPALLAERDPDVWRLLTDPAFRLPRRLPDGRYAD